MNKKIWVLTVGSVFALPVLAQSNVAISGKISMSYKNHKVGNTIRANMAAENRLDDNSSRFRLVGKEDLGGGTYAYFQIENRFQADARPKRDAVPEVAALLADGESYVGIGGKSWGQIGFGKYELHFNEVRGEKYLAGSNQEAVFKNILAVVGGGKNNKIAFVSRAQNVIKYDTQKWNGFSGKLAYSFNPAGNEGLYAAGNPSYNKGSAWNVAARYANGPVDVYASYWTYDIEGRGGVGGVAADQVSYKLGADYRFPMGLSIGLHYDRSKIKNIVTAAGAIGGAAVGNRDATRSAWMIPVSYKFGSHVVHLTYGKAGNTNGIIDSGARNWVLGYDYALSKRTAVGAYYSHLKNKTNGFYQFADSGSFQGGSASGAGESQRQFSLGVSHSF
ncbi:MAG: porin [Proteobacteria bacterium]|nr:porin [Pseudomonadota bacterium]